MSNEVYTVYLKESDPRGVRKEHYKQAEGWQMDRLDNGVVMLLNEGTGSLVEYSPYAWQSVMTENINFQEDA